MRFPRKSSTFLTWVLAAWAAVGILAHSERANACASCACGDVTLTTMGVEKPFEGRFRLGTLFQMRSATEGTTGIDRVATDEQRFDIALSYAVRSDVVLGLQIPLIRRRQSFVNLGEESAFGLGDVRPQVRWILWQDSPVLANHLLALQAAVDLPTAPILRENGERLDADIQPGRGSIIPQAGLLYSFFARPWSIHLSTNVRQPFISRLNVSQGTSWLYTAMGQYQPWDWLALQAGADGRWSARTTRDGVREENSGGSILFSSFGASASPMTDLVVNATVRVPVFNGLNDRHSERWMLVAGVAYDL